MNHDLTLRKPLNTSAEPNWIGIRFLDPVGKVFKRDGYFYRAVYPSQIEHVQRVLDSSAYRQLVLSRRIVPMEQTTERLDNFGMVLRSKELPWATYPSEWVTSSLMRAALLWIDMNQVLSTSGYELADAHHANYKLDDRCLPVWVDLGSIQPATRRITALKQFIETQVYPLLCLCSGRKMGRLVRPLLSKGGISRQEFRSIMPFEPRGHLLDVLCWLNESADRRFFGAADRRGIIFSLLKRLLLGLRAEPEKGVWSDYRPLESVPQAKADPRARVIADLVEELGPASIMDVGANDGYFSALLAARGYKVLAVDSDEYALSKFVRWANDQPDSFAGCAAGCLGNFHDVPHRAELVLGLALTHHIALTELYKFDYIAKRFAEMSNEHLITEFMPNGLGSLEMPDNLPEWYKLEHFLTELGRWWNDVRVVDYKLPLERAPRTLIVCRSKKVHS